MLKLNSTQTAAALLFGATSLCIASTGAFAAISPEPNTASATPPISQAYATTQITGDGYTQPTDLQQSNGGWTAKAQEGGKPVSLMVSAMGGVEKQ